MNRLHESSPFRKGAYRRRYPVPYSLRMRPTAGLTIVEPKKGPYKPGYGPILIRCLDYAKPA
jgi:hypothetical protein